MIENNLARSNGNHFALDETQYWTGVAIRDLACSRLKQSRSAETVDMNSHLRQGIQHPAPKNVQLRRYLGDHIAARPRKEPILVAILACWRLTVGTGAVQ